MKFLYASILFIILRPVPADRTKKFVKETFAVQDEPKSDYRCKGYILINDLNLLFCKHKLSRADIHDGLTASIMINAGENDESNGFDGTAYLVAESLFRKTNLTAYDRALSGMWDTLWVGKEDTRFDIHELSSVKSRKFHRFVQQLIKADFEPLIIDSIMKERRPEDYDAIYYPAARDNWRYKNYGKVFKDGKYHNGTERIVDKKRALDLMENFYQNFYSSDKMIVVMDVGIQYEEKYIELLSAIPKRKSFASNNYKIGYKLMVPNEKLLRVYFPLKQLGDRDEVAYTTLSEYFFNTDVSNSFEWMLTEAGFATKATTSCYANSWSSKDSVFEISIKLTGNGLKNVDKVLELIFSYLNRIKSIKVEQWIHDEVMKSIDPFESKIKYNLIENLFEVANRASRFGPKNALIGPSKNFNEASISSILPYLNAYNFNFICGIPNTSTNQQMTLSKIPWNTLMKLNNIRAKEADIVDMPIKNVELEQKECATHFDEYDLPGDNEGTSDKIILDQPGKMLQLLPTRPNANSTYILFSFMILVPKDIFGSVESYANFMLMANVLHILVNKELLAKMSGRGCYNFEIEYHHTGLKVLILAEPENIDFVLDNMFYILKHKHLIPKSLGKARRKLRIVYKFEDFSLATYENLLRSVPPVDDRMVAAVDNASESMIMVCEESTQTFIDATVDSVGAMFAVMSQAIQLNALVIAPIQEQAAIDMFKRLVSKFRSTGATIQKVNINSRKVLQLRAGSKYVYETTSADDDNVALVAYQTNISDTEMVMYAYFFDRFHYVFLEKQMSDCFKHDGINIKVERMHDGSIVYIVRGNQAPHEMEALLDKFMRKELETALEKFTENDNYSFSYLYRDTSLLARLNNPVTNGKSNLNKNFPNRFDMVKVFRTMFDVKMMRKLAIYMYAQGSDKITRAILPENAYQIENVTKFRSEHSFLYFEG